MASTASTRVDLTVAMLESIQDNTSAWEIVTTTDDNGVVQFVPNMILEADGSRLSDVPMDRLLSLLPDVCDNLVPGEGTNEDLGLATALLATNEGGGDATLRDLRKRRTIVGRVFEIWRLAPSLQGPLGRACDVPHWVTPRTCCCPHVPVASTPPTHPPSTTTYTLPPPMTPPPRTAVLGKHGRGNDTSS